MKARFPRTLLLCLGFFGYGVVLAESGRHSGWHQPAGGPYAIAATDGPQAPVQVPGAFRSRITMVPVDVRVLDRDGKPVTDLKQDDFAIVEDDAPQRIGYFSSHAFTPTAPSPDAPALRGAPGDGLSVANHRTFLIVLGRGRLQLPGQNLDALMDFLRQRLLPQDRIAVVAYNRATDFTTDHTKAAELIERFKTRHERVEADLNQHFSGLRVAYGSRTIPPYIQKQIDELFHWPGALESRSLTPGRIGDSGRIGRDARREADDLQRAELDEAAGGRLPGPFDVRLGPVSDVTLDEYIARHFQTMQDLGNLYAGIEYIRHLDGEKRLVFVTAEGLTLPGLDGDKTLAAVASDARIALDVLITGGVVGAAAPRINAMQVSRSTRLEPVPSADAVFRQTFRVQAAKLVAEMTGGQARAFRSGEAVFTELDRTTRFQYLLGYSPSNASWDGAFRRISIKVNRPDVTVHYRQGYYAREQLVPFDRREFLTYSRIGLAGNYDGKISDLAVSLKASIKGQEVIAEVTIGPTRIAFTESDGRHNAALHVAFFCADGGEDLVGELWQNIDLKLKEDTYRRFERVGTTHSARIPVKTRPKYVKVVVYHYGADLIGTAMVRVP